MIVKYFTFTKLNSPKNVNNVNVIEKNNMSISLPLDFDVTIYKLLNQDMRALLDIDAEQHYVMHGRNEKREYKEPPLPPLDFDVSMYKILNVDLRYMSDRDAQTHYVLHGCNENRVYIDTYFSYEFFRTTYSNIEMVNLYTCYIMDIRQEKNNYFSKYINSLVISKEHKYIMLVNHDNKLFGANHYMYGLFLYLKKMYIHDNIKIFICEFDNFFLFFHTTP